MRNLALLLTIFFCLSSNLLAPIKTSPIFDTYKICIVMSYSPSHPCSTPQLFGFLDSVQKVESLNIKIIPKMFYLQSRKYTLEEVKQRASEIINIINLDKPDIIVTIDDIAFEYVGIPLSGMYPVFASGINRSLSVYKKEYKDTYNIDNIYVIRETVDLSKFLSLTKDLSLNLSDIYILRSPGIQTSKTERYVLSDIKLQLRNTQFRVHELTIESKEQLKIVLKDLNKKSSSIIIPLVFKAKDCDLLSILSIVKKLNRKHIVLCPNLIFCQYGCNVCTSMNFYKSGLTLGSMLIDFLEGNNVNHEVFTDTLLAVNYTSLELMGYHALLEKVKEIDKFIAR